MIRMIRGEDPRDSLSSPKPSTNDESRFEKQSPCPSTRPRHVPFPRRPHTRALARARPRSSSSARHGVARDRAVRRAREAEPCERAEEAAVGATTRGSHCCNCGIGVGGEQFDDRTRPLHPAGSLSHPGARPPTQLTGKTCLFEATQAVVVALRSARLAARGDAAHRRHDRALACLPQCAEGP